MEKFGFIYILTNKSFHQSNWIKIGYSENVERRVKELSNTSVPLPFEIYATYEIPKFEGVNPDKAIHDLIQRLNPELRISQNREFFEIEPWDAYELLRSIAIIHGRLDKLKRNDSNNFGADIVEEDFEYTEEMLFNKSQDIRHLFDKMESIISETIPGLEKKATKHYVTYKKRKKRNVISIWPKENCLEVVLNAKLGTISDDADLIYDTSNRKWSAAQYAFKFDLDTDVQKVKDLLEQTYKLVK